MKNRLGMHGGGLSLMWAKDVFVDLRRKGSRFIDAWVHGDGGPGWRLIGVYGWVDSR